MTLVAAFSIEGIHALVGDLLLTDSETRRNHTRLPTRPGLEMESPATGKRRIHGFRKKIQKIGDRLVVGFTGDVAAGELLLSALNNRFCKGPLALRDLQELLANFRCENSNQTELVGWVWEKRLQCFHWRGSAPSNLDLVPSAFAGSGATHFKNEIMTAQSCSMSPEVTNALEKAIFQCVSKAGKVLFTELLGGENLEYDYGFGAEVILWDGAKFFYIDKVAYAFWNIEIDPDNGIKVLPHNVSAIYKNYDRFSVMQVSQIQMNTGFFSGFSAKETEVHMITPIHDAMPDFDATSIGRETYDDAPLWFSGFVVTNPLTGARAVCSMVSECVEGIEPFTSYKHGVLYLNLTQLREMLPDSLFNPNPV